MYALALMMVGLLILVHRLAPSPGWRIFLEVGVLGFSYGLIAFWLETHSNVLLDGPVAETDSPAVESPQVEMSTALSPRVQVHFYTGSGPIIIYHLPEASTSHLRSNGHHHPPRTIPALPAEAAKQFTNN
jgi:hypothetical protein